MIRVLGRVGLSCVTLQIDFGHSDPGDESIGENQAVVGPRAAAWAFAQSPIFASRRRNASEAAGWVWDSMRQINATFAEFHVGLPPADEAARLPAVRPNRGYSQRRLLGLPSVTGGSTTLKRAYRQENLHACCCRHWGGWSPCGDVQPRQPATHHTGPPPPLARRKQLARQPFDDTATGGPPDALDGGSCGSRCSPAGSPSMIGSTSASSVRKPSASGLRHGRTMLASDHCRNLVGGWSRVCTCRGAPPASIRL